MVTNRRNAIRVLHTSDLHLGDTTYKLLDGNAPKDRNRETLGALASFARKEQVDLLMIAGDFFDHNRVETPVIDLVIESLGSLAIPVVILPGNHDCVVPESVYHRVDFSREADNLYVFSALEGETFSFPKLDLALWGKPIDDYGGPIRPLLGMPPRGPERWQLAIAHGHYVGRDRDSIYSLQIFDEDILRSERDYIGLGHWDTFTSVSQGETKAYYSGSPSHFGISTVVEMDEKLGVRVTCHSLREELDGH